MTAVAMPDAFVLDTSALLALRANESGADRVERILRSAAAGRGDVLLSFMTRMEILYCIRRDESEEAATEALRLIDAGPVKWVSCEPAILDVAVRLKAEGGLSVADAWIAATAVVRGARLVHKDPEFRDVAVSQEEL